MNKHDNNLAKRRNHMRGSTRRAARFTDRKKEANRRACRGRFRGNG